MGLHWRRSIQRYIYGLLLSIIVVKAIALLIYKKYINDITLIFYKSAHTILTFFKIDIY
jgi:hypothetical protein